ncbi:uncharacterized protein LOC128278951 [Anopheles cruzii]|uniref:uncharacterized protein LOC128278951 n=1 Tax=Anopheles cruzii TaxID=68878 RepID=UPI0022EC575D|nr:uncharacterized protein LOC128278951 [Anopheles cruzii]
MNQQPEEARPAEAPTRITGNPLANSTTALFASPDRAEPPAAGRTESAPNHAIDRLANLIGEMSSKFTDFSERLLAIERLNDPRQLGAGDPIQHGAHEPHGTRQPMQHGGAEREQHGDRAPGQNGFTQHMGNGGGHVPTSMHHATPIMPAQTPVAFTEPRPAMYQHIPNPSGVYQQAHDPRHVSYQHAWPQASLNQSQISARQGVPKDLPPFSGMAEEWPIFIASFENSTAICGYSAEENLLRLQKALRGKALEAVRYRLLHPSNLDGAIATLRTLFGRPEVIVHNMVSKIRRLPPPSEQRIETLIDFGVAVQNMCATIQAAGLDDYMCNVALLQELVDKLPPTIKLKWAFHKQALQRVTLADFGIWMEIIVSAVSSVTLPTEETPHDKRRNNGSKQRTTSQYINTHVAHDLPPAGDGCVICKGRDCVLPNCKQFQDMSVGERWTAVKRNRLCRTCLVNHAGQQCSQTLCGINGCSYAHHRYLHQDKKLGPTPASTSNPTPTSTCNVHQLDNKEILFRYVPVVITANGRRVETYAFLDDGSSSTFIDRKLATELGVEGRPRPICLKWTDNQSREETDSLQLSLRISGVGPTAQQYTLQKVHTLSNLELPTQSVAVEELANQYAYLRGHQIPSYQNVSPKLLIGMDNCHLGYPIDCVEGGTGEPAAIKTRLGWILHGPCPGRSREPVPTYHALHICECRKGDAELGETLNRYLAIESLGVAPKDSVLHSKDEERALQLLVKETRLVGNHYETGLLWRHDDVRLPCNRAMALRRDTCLRRRMVKDPTLAASIRTTMEAHEAKGYIRRLTEKEVNAKGPRDWYLPIFPVINPNKPDKIRIVFDAAAEVNGVSLNKCLLTGPDQLSSLPSVLHRFREHGIAVVGDIREMFFQVKMKAEDQRSQLFYWCGNENDTKAASDVYALTVMTFGAACSPSAAQFVKNINAERFVEKYPKAVDCIKTLHYVDDMLASVDTEDEAIKLCEEVRYIHAQGGFEITNWLSNSERVLCSLQQQEKQPPLPKETSQVHNLCPTPSTAKVLGMWWDMKADVFTYRRSIKHEEELLSCRRPPTKRDVLRTLMAVYDPLGLIGHYLMYLKVVLQEIWRAKIDWDEELSSDLIVKWKAWVELLPDLQRVSVPRCYDSTRYRENSIVQLHVFCDASECGMAAVAYFRIVKDSSIKCALIGSKTRVAPTSFVSIPRLELQAAVIGARFASNIAQSHEIPIVERFFWTDSRNVISWLKSDHRRYSQFVAFRVSEILETTKANNWNWISTKLNIADDATKWTTTPRLDPGSRWFQGPDFLWATMDQWPNRTFEGSDTQEELRPNLLHHHIQDRFLEFERFSKWRRLVRAIGYVLRFTGNARCIKKSSRCSGPLTEDELGRAERIIIRVAQQETFAEEIRALKGPIQKHPYKPVLRKKSSLYKVSPELDENSVLRVSGRLANCPWIDEATKKPIILPRRHLVTDLIINYTHRRYHHHGHQTAINALRSHYHIPRLRVEFNRVRKQCQRCKNRDARPVNPLMGNLPKERLAAFRPAFCYSGLDYFGPMTVAVGRRVEKRWGALFMCLTTRAIHVELVHSLNTSSCILAIRRFIARRGKPLEIISDCGTNFIGASRELKEAWKQVDSSRLIEETTTNLRWVFNPPGAPHFGGSWERLIGSVKKGLREMRLPRLPTDEILQSTLAEVEFSVNSRPLTDVPIDVESEPPLTPNHFLLGTFNGDKPQLPFDDHPATVKTSWLTSQKLADIFWKKWIREYLPTLTRRSKWVNKTRPIAVGDVVVIADENSPRNYWPRGIVVNVVQAKDGQVRRVMIQSAGGQVYERPATKVAVLDVKTRT